MAKEYLDKTGLTYLWSKIKERFATKASPAFTGTPTAPTPSTGASNTQIATTEFVADAIGNIVKTATDSGTTNYGGAIRLSNVPNDAIILAVAVTSGEVAGGANWYGIPFKYNNAVWYASIVDWQNLSLQTGKSLTTISWYI